jgi:curli biogenesis system outer membrane secretion channel CsgG
MKVIKYILTGLLLTGMITGCGQTTVETLKVATPVAPNAAGKGMTAIILPFADYSYADDLESAHRRNMAITEALTDQLVHNGFNLPVQEDVFHYLVDEKIISLASYDQGRTTTLAYELADTDWSDTMHRQIQHYINMENAGKHETVADSPGTHGLTRQEVVKMGRKFGADYIIRGRILEFKTRQEHTWNPLKRGIIPFAVGTTNQTFFGFADSAKYDDWGNMITGGTMGAIVGYNVQGPWNSGSSAVGSGANTFFWGAVGTGLGHMAGHGGQVDQAVVQMRIWVQDAYTGNVVWTNREDVKVSPKSVMADRQLDALFDAAIERGTRTLMNDFVTTAL